MKTIFYILGALNLVAAFFSFMPFLAIGYMIGFLASALFCFASGYVIDLLEQIVEQIKAARVGAIPGAARSTPSGYEDTWQGWAYRQLADGRVETSRNGTTHVFANWREFNAAVAG